MAYSRKPVAHCEHMVFANAFSRASARPVGKPFMSSLRPPTFIELDGLESVLHRSRRFATSRLKPPILILGERGTGKSALARFIAMTSGDPGLFVKANSAEISDDAAAVSYLFGHSRHAYTDAGPGHVGAFERAHGGTLFLDELSRLGPRAQALLLTTLDDGMFNRMGDNRVVEVSVRFVAATNADPEVLVRQGQLAPDLYGRLRAYSVTLPPLRKRPHQILPLARHFLDHIARFEEDGRRRFVLTERAQMLLLTSPWPDNIRGLFDACLVAARLAESDVLDAENFEAATTGQGWMPPEGQARAQDRLSLIHAMLTETGGNKAAAARRLGMGLTTLKQALKRRPQSISYSPGRDRMTGT